VRHPRMRWAATRSRHDGSPTDTIYLNAKTGLLTGLLAGRETCLEMPCCPASDLLWVHITQSYPNRLRFSSLPCPQSPCHIVIDPVFKE
jgi:hypothetical protein